MLLLNIYTLHNILMSHHAVGNQFMSLHRELHYLTT